MYFQKVLKGIAGLSDEDVYRILLHEGILCNWWRNKEMINESEVKTELTLDNLIHHLDDYAKPLPTGHRWKEIGKTYGDVSAFISTTSGTVQRDGRKKRNILHPPFMTALRFATSKYQANGWIFYAYVMTLGKPSVELKGFSEDVRDLHIYTDYRLYHHEGEVTAKISIPSVNIEKAEYYEGPAILADLRMGRKPHPTNNIIIDNKAVYQPPEKYSNIREVLTK
jgi:hypothetical protein